MQQANVELRKANVLKAAFLDVASHELNTPVTIIMGMSERDVPHIFDPFFSTFDTLHHSSGNFEYGKRGLGMGLAIVQKFVEMHGGTVRVQPQQPRETSFVIEMPSRSAP